MSTTVNGTLQFETIGWDRSGAKSAILLPMTCVALLSIIAAFIYIKEARQVNQDNRPVNGLAGTIPFDSSNSMHLVFAAAEGNLQHILGQFGEFRERGTVVEAEKIQVQLEYIDDGKIRLVRV